jgi:hypothetical protein
MIRANPGQRYLKKGAPKAIMLEPGIFASYINFNASKTPQARRCIRQVPARHLWYVYTYNPRFGQCRFDIVPYDLNVSDLGSKLVECSHIIMLAPLRNYISVFIGISLHFIIIVTSTRTKRHAHEK